MIEINVKNKNVFLEMTNSVHGGQDWELGKCLWSPKRAKDGKDSWKTMLLPQIGDIVIHSVKTSKGHMFIAYSLVAEVCKEIKSEPPIPGRWAGYDVYYYVGLKDYKKLTIHKRMQKFLDTHKVFLGDYNKSFFTVDLKPAQKYLTLLEPIIADKLLKYL